MERQDYERISRIEAELENITKLLTKLDAKFDSLNTVFAPRSELNVMFSQRDEKIQNLQKEIEELKVEKRNNKALAPAWAGVVVGVISLLITIYTVIIRGG